MTLGSLLLGLFRKTGLVNESFSPVGLSHSLRSGILRFDLRPLFAPNCGMVNGPLLPYNNGPCQLD